MLDPLELQERYLEDVLRYFSAFVRPEADLGHVKENLRRAQERNPEEDYGPNSQAYP